MAKALVDHALWERLEPRLPRLEPRRTGRPRVPDRAALTGIVFVLQTRIPWEYLPRQMGWVVERTIRWLRQSTRLRVRCECRADIHDAFLALGCILICCGIAARVF
jgi:transposase